MSKLARSAAMVCLALLIGACGGTTKTGTTGPTPSDTASPSPSPTDTPLAASGAGDCGIGKALAESNAAATAAGTDVKESLKKAGEALDKLVDLVPADLRADARTVALGYRSYYAVFAQYGYNFRMIPQQKMIAAVQAIGSPDFTAAAKRVFGYFATRCGMPNPYGG